MSKIKYLLAAVGLSFVGLLAIISAFYLLGLLLMLIKIL